MAFIEYKTKSRGLHKTYVRISFTNIYNNKFLLSICIPKEIGEKAGFKAADYVKLSYLKDDERMWLLTKSTQSEGGIKITAPSSVTLKIDMTWTLFVPKNNDMRMREVPYKFIQEGIGINAALEPESLKEFIKDLRHDSKKRTAGAKGAAARNKSLSPEKRKELAQKAANARWKK